MYHKGIAKDKYMDKYLIVAYALIDLQLHFRYVVFVWTCEELRLSDDEQPYIR